MRAENAYLYLVGKRGNYEVKIMANGKSYIKDYNGRVLVTEDTTEVTPRILHRNEKRYLWVSFRSGSIKVGTGGIVDVKTQMMAATPSVWGDITSVQVRSGDDMMGGGRCLLPSLRCG